MTPLRGVTATVPITPNPCHLLVKDLDVRVVNAITGELLRELTIDPDRDQLRTPK